jgi:Na+/glutamate symporter
VFRVRIGSKLVVNIVILDRIDQVITNNTVDRVTIEIFAGVLLWYYLSLSLGIIEIPCSSDQLADLSDIV